MSPSILACVGGVGIAGASAQPRSPVTWTLSAPATAAANATISATVTAAIDPGWHLYSITQPPGGPITTTIVTPEASAFERVGDIRGPAPKTFNDPNFDNLETEYYDTQAVFAVPVRAKATTTPGAQTLTIAARFQACNDTTCTLPRTVTLTAPITVTPAGTAQAATPRGATEAAATRAASIAAPADVRQATTPPMGQGASARRPSAPRLHRRPDRRRQLHRRRPSWELHRRHPLRLARPLRCRGLRARLLPLRRAPAPRRRRRDRASRICRGSSASPS